MDFLNRLFGKTASVRPEDYRPLYVRWDKSGKEYGPLTFNDIVTRNWSRSPIQVRFENESKWRNYNRVLEILDGLEASDDQVKKLAQKGVLFPDAPRPAFTEAVTKLDRIATEERVAKAKQPATPYMRKKMDRLGIAYPSEITRAEAKALVDQHEERVAVQKAANALHKQGVGISEDLLNTPAAHSEDLGDELEELLEILEELRDLGLDLNPPNINSLHILQKTNTQYREALDEAENVEYELEERDLIIGYDEFRLVGTLPKKGMRAIKQTVAERYVAGSWNFERDVLEVVAEYMPKVRIRQQDD